MARVVCTLWVTIDTFAPTSRLTSVDLPAFGAPISATKPECVCRRAVASVISAALSSVQTPSRMRKAVGRGFFGASRGTARWRDEGAKPGNVHGDSEYGLMIGSLARLDRYSGRAPLCLRDPFLKFGFRIARLFHDAMRARLPIAHDEGPRRLHAAVQIDRRDQRLDRIGQVVAASCRP